MYRFGFIFLFVSTSQAQNSLVSVGVKGGVPLSETVAGSYSTRDESRPILFGPSVEFRLPGRFAVEVSALYQRVGVTNTYLVAPLANNTTSFISRTRVNAWQFPVLGKYYFQPRTNSWQPYLGTGYTIRTGWATTEGSTTVTENGVQRTTLFAPEYRVPTTVGIVAAAGVRFKAGRFSISPEFRYQYSGEAAPSPFRRNQGHFLLGINF